MPEIMESIVKIIEEGGPLALWGLVLYMLLSAVKPLAIGGAWCFVIRSILWGSKDILKHYNDRKEQRVSLLSKECSDKVLALLDTTRATFSAASESQSKAASQVLVSLGTELDKLGEMLDSLRSDPTIQATSSWPQTPPGRSPDPSGLATSEKTHDV